MEPQRRPKIEGLATSRCAFNVRSRTDNAGARRDHLNREHNLRPDKVRLRAGHVRAETLALVALAIRFDLQRQGVMIVAVAASFNRHMSHIGSPVLQTMARPVAAPARHGLYEHEARHQFGYECMHRDSIILPNHYRYRLPGQRGL
jgi:hypothetical protein